MAMLRLMFVLVTTWFMISGCEKALVPPDAQRTPYERFQVLRGRYRSATQTNAFGGEQPALRDRLQPLESR